MSHRRAKRVRQGIFPSGQLREEAGCSRGHFMRSMTRYTSKQQNVFSPNETLLLKPGTPRQIYQTIKRRIHGNARST